MDLLLHTRAALESIEARMRRSTIRCEPPASSVLKLVSAHTRLLAISKPPSRAALKRAAALLESIGSATASMDGFYHALDCSGIPEIMKVRAFRRFRAAPTTSQRGAASAGASVFMHDFVRRHAFLRGVREARAVGGGQPKTYVGRRRHFRDRRHFLINGGGCPSPEPPPKSASRINEPRGPPAPPPPPPCSHP